jgi:gluconolactonase
LVVPVAGQNNQYIVSKGRDLDVMEWDGHSTAPSTLTKLLSVEPNLPSNRFNDGKVDAMGRLWAGAFTIIALRVEKRVTYEFRFNCHLHGS